MYKDHYVTNEGNEVKLNSMQIILIFYDYGYLTNLYLRNAMSSTCHSKEDAFIM